MILLELPEPKASSHIHIRNIYFYTQNQTILTGNFKNGTLFFLVANQENSQSENIKINYLFNEYTSRLNILCLYLYDGTNTKIKTKRKKGRNSKIEASLEVNF